MLLKDFRLGKLLAGLSSKRPENFSATSEDAREANKDAADELVKNPERAFISDVRNLLQQAEQAIPVEHRPDPASIDHDKVRTMAETMVTQIGLYMPEFVKEEKEADYAKSLADSFDTIREEPINLLIALNAVSPDTFEALARRMAGDDFKLNTSVGRMVKVAKEQPDCPAFPDQRLLYAARENAYKYGLHYAPARANNALDLTNTRKRKASIAAHFRIMADEHSEEMRDIFEIVMPGVKKQKEPTKPRPITSQFKAKQISPEAQIKAKKEGLKAKIDLVQIDIEEFENKITAEKKRRPELDEELEFIPLLIEEAYNEYVSAMEALGAHYERYDELASQLEKSGKVFRPLSADARIDTKNIKPKPEVSSPDLSGIERKFVGPNNQDLESLPTTDHEIAPLVQVIKQLRKERASREADCNFLSAQNDILSKALEAQQHKESDLARLTEVANEQAGQYEIRNYELESVLAKPAAAAPANAPA